MEIWHESQKILILEMLQLWGFMKVVDVYVNLTGINHSEYLHSLRQNSVVAYI